MKNILLKNKINLVVIDNSSLQHDFIRFINDLDNIYFVKKLNRDKIKNIKEFDYLISEIKNMSNLRNIHSKYDTIVFEFPLTETTVDENYTFFEYLKYFEYKIVFITYNPIFLNNPIFKNNLNSIFILKDDLKCIKNSTNRELKESQNLTKLFIAGEFK